MEEQFVFQRIAELGENLGVGRDHVEGGNLLFEKVIESVFIAFFPTGGKSFKLFLAREFALFTRLSPSQA